MAATVLGVLAAFPSVASANTVSATGILRASDGAANDGFGSSVAISNTTAVVGAPAHAVAGNADQGAAYVFARTGSGWSQTAELTAADGAAGDRFATSVSITGTTIVVGAPGRTVGANEQQGAAYVFARSGTKWSQSEITAPNGAAHDAFGTSVGVSVNELVVGAPGAEINGNGNANEGGAYVFAKSGSTWKQQAELTSSDGTAGDAFGTSVAIASTTAVVGAPSREVSSVPDSGAAYVFAKSGTSWAQSAELTQPAPYFADLGTSVDVVGSSVIAGAPGSGPMSDTPGLGAALIFQKNAISERNGVAKGWQFLQQEGGSETAADQGLSVALSSSTALVGAPDASLNGPGLTQVGTGYAANKFSNLSNAPWGPGPQLASPAVANDLAGFSVALTDSYALMGIPDFEVGTNPGQGEVEVFDVAQIHCRTCT